MTRACIGSKSLRPILAATAGVVMTLDAGARAAAPLYVGPAVQTLPNGKKLELVRQWTLSRSAGNGVGAGYGEVGPGSPTPRDGYVGVRYGTTGDGTLLNQSGAFAYGWAYAVNNANVTVGQVENRAARWSPSSPNAVLLDAVSVGTNGIVRSTARAINDAGVTVGSANIYSPTGTSRGTGAVRWSATDTSATLLGNLAGGTNSSGNISGANDISETGIIVGSSTRYISGSDYGSRAVRWMPDSANAIELGNIGTLNGFTIGGAEAVNNAGTTVGWMRKVVNGEYRGERPVRWNAGTTEATELGVLGTAANGSTGGKAVSVNDAGTAVGYVTDHVSGTSVGTRAVRWAANAANATRLSPLEGAGPTQASSAYAINAAGITAGHQATATASYALAWTPDNVAIDLNTLLSPAQDALWHLQVAADISDTFWMTGYGLFDADGPGGTAAYHRAFLLDVISVFGTPGDATRDGRVNFSDLLVVAQNYGVTGSATWDRGDFNSDNAVNFADLLTLAQRYGTGTTPQAALAPFGDDFAADWSLAQSLVPEPISLTTTAGLVMMVARRPRRRED